MDEQETFKPSLSAQAQQSQQECVPSEYGNYAWVPPQWTQLHAQTHHQHAQNASHDVQAAQYQPAHSVSQFTVTNGLPPSHLQLYSPIHQNSAYYSPKTLDDLPHPPAAPTTPTTPSWLEYLNFARSRTPRPVEAEVDWLEFVDALPWLVNNEIPKEDRTCPFCWGEFGMDLVYEEEEISDSSSESEKEDGDDGYSTYTYNGPQVVVPTLDGAVAGLPVTNPDPPTSEVESEGDEDGLEDANPSKPTEKQKSMVRQLRRGLGLELEETKIGQKHYAVQLPCGHLYGQMCLVKMLESGEKVCPKCRKDIVGERPYMQ